MPYRKHSLSSVTRRAEPGERAAALRATGAVGPPEHRPAGAARARPTPTGSGAPAPPADQGSRWCGPPARSWARARSRSVRSAEIGARIVALGRAYPSATPTGVATRPWPPRPSWMTYTGAVHGAPGAGRGARGGRARDRFTALERRPGVRRPGCGCRCERSEEPRPAGRAPAPRGAGDGAAAEILVLPRRDDTTGPAF